MSNTSHTFFSLGNKYGFINIDICGKLDLLERNNIDKIIYEIGEELIILGSHAHGTTVSLEAGTVRRIFSEPNLSAQSEQLSKLIKQTLNLSFADRSSTVISDTILRISKVVFSNLYFLNYAKAAWTPVLIDGMTHNVAAQFLGGSFIAKTTLEEKGKEEKLEEQILSNTLSIFLSFLSQAQKAKATKAGDAIDDAIKDKFTSLHAIFKEARYFEISCTSASRFSEDIQSITFAQQMIKKLRSLPEEQRIVIAGGWNGRPSHYMVYEIYKEPGGTFRMRIFNLGAGIEYHPAALIGKKLKYLPFLEQAGISAENMCRQEVWRAYYQHRFTSPKSNEQFFDARCIYENFLESIHPKFGQAMHASSGPIEYYMTRQLAGTCAVDSLLAFTRVELGNKKEYEIFRNTLVYQVLSEYYHHLDKEKYFGINPPLKLSRQNIITRLGVLHFLRACADKVACVTSKSLRHHLMTPEEGEAAKKLLYEIARRAKYAKIHYKKLYEESSPLLELLPTFQNSFAFSELKSDDDSKKTARVWPLSLNLDSKWPNDGTQIHEKLTTSTQIALQYYNGGWLKTTAQFISLFFREMPSVSATLWDSIPEDQIVPCMEKIVSLSNIWLKCRIGMGGTLITQIDAMCDSLKALAVVQKLIMCLKDDPDMVSQCCIYLSLLEKMMGDMPLTNPKLEREFSENIQFLKQANLQYIGEGKTLQDNMFFLNLNVKTDVYLYLNSDSGYEKSMREKIKNGEWKRKEEVFVFRFLENHPEIKDQIGKKLQQTSGTYPTMSLIVAEAIRDLDAQYMPRAFCALKKQTMIAQSVAWVKSHSLAGNEADFIIKFNGRLQDSVVRFDENSLIMTAIDNAEYFPMHKTRSKIKTEIFDSFQYLHYYEFSQNEHMLFMHRSEENYFLSAAEDASQVAVKLIAYFSSHREKLKSIDYQRIFESLLFGPAILKNQLQATPEFAIVLARFFQSSCIIAKEIDDLNSTLFLLRMASYAIEFCKDNAIAENVIALFPDIIEELGKIVREDSKLPGRKSLIIRELLAAYYRSNQLALDCYESIFKMAFYLSENPIPSSYEMEYAPHIDQDVQRLFRYLAQRLISFNAGLRNLILSAAVNSKNILEWQCHEAMMTSEDNKYTIDLFAGRLYIDGLESGILPESLEQSAIFQQISLSKENLTEVQTQSHNLAFFKDKLRNRYCAFFTGGQWKVQRQFLVDGSLQWCDFYPPDMFTGRISAQNTVISKCICWQDPQSKDLHFFTKDNNRLSYRYFLRSGQLICIDGGPRNNLSLISNFVSASDAIAIKILFETFDSSVQFWSNENSHKIQLIESPKFGLNFEVTFHKEIGTINLLPREEGLRLCNEQYLSALRKITGYLVLQNLQGQKNVLIPRRQFIEATSLSKPALPDRNLTKQDHCIHYTYQVNAKGQLSSHELPQRIYLAYLHLIQRDYKNARQQLLKSAKLHPYSSEEAGLLNLVANSKIATSDHDIRACAIRLKASALLAENNKRLRVLEEVSTKVDWQKSIEIGSDLNVYAAQCDIAATYALDRDEELILLENMSLDSFPLLSRRIKFLRAEKQLEQFAMLKEQRQKIGEVDFNTTEAMLQGMNLSPIIDTDILDHIGHCVYHTKEQMSRCFLSYYAIAKDEPAASEKRKRLACLLTLARYPAAEALEYSAGFWITLLKSIFQNPDGYPPTREIQALFHREPFTSKWFGENAHRSEFTGRNHLTELMSAFEALLFTNATSKYCESLKKTAMQEFSIWHLPLGHVPENPQQFVAISRTISSIRLPPICPRLHLEATSENDNLNDQKWKAMAAIAEKELPQLHASVTHHLAAKKSMLAEPKDREEKIILQISSLDSQISNLIRRIRTLEDSRDYVSSINSAPFFKIDDEAPKEKAIKEKSRIELVARMHATNKFSSNRVEHNAICDLANDVEAFLTQPSQKQATLCRSELPRLKDLLIKKRSLCTAQLSAAKKRLAALAKKMPLNAAESRIFTLDKIGGQRKSISFKDLQLLYVRSDLSEYLRQNPALTALDAQTLYYETEDYLIRATLQQQIERALKSIEALEKVPKGTDADSLMQEIYLTLAATRAYEPRTHPEFLVFEYQANLLMREDQVLNIEKLMNKRSNIILQMIMGAGKSDILLPLLALRQADGEALSIVMVPEQLLEQISANMKVRSGEIFNQAANRLNWLETSKQGLQIILSNLERIRSRREFLIVTDKEMHDFSLRAREHRLHCCTCSGLSEDEITTELLFRSIKTFLKQYGNVIVDEVDSILYCRRQVQVALGEGEKVNPLYFAITTILYTFLLTNPVIRSKVNFEFSQNELQAKEKAEPFTPASYDALKETISHEVLQKLFTEGFFQNCPSGLLSEIHNYVLAEEGTKGLSLSPDLPLDLRNGLAFLRSEIHSFLPLTLNRRYGETYGFFPETSQQPSLIAGPYEGANRPRIGSQFAHYAEQINYTRQAFAKTGILLAHLKPEIARIQNAVAQEMISTGIAIPTRTLAYKEYVDIVGEDFAKDNALKKLHSDEAMKSVVKLISGDIFKLQKFVGDYFLPSIKRYPRSLNSNAQHLSNFFGRFNGFTGTLPTQCGTFHDRFTLARQRGIEGSILTILAQNSLHDVTLVDETDPAALFEKLLCSREGNRYFALIDEGALFKDISYRDMAQKVLEIRIDLTAAIYFDGDRRMILKREGPPLPYNLQNDVAPNLRFTLYDQRHCRGTHFDQDPNAYAWMTTNRIDNFSNFEQGIYRMRQIAAGQRISFLVPRDLHSIVEQQKLASQDVVDLSFDVLPDGSVSIGTRPHPQTAAQDVIDLMICLRRLQAQQQAEDNLVAIQQKLDHVIFSACESILDKIPVRDLFSEAAKALNELLIATTEDSPYDQFKQVASLEAASIVLQHNIDTTLQRVEVWQKAHDPTNIYRLNIAGLRREMEAIVSRALEQYLINDRLPFNPLCVARDTSRDMSVEVSAQMQSEAKVSQEQKSEQELERHRWDLSKQLFPAIPDSWHRNSSEIFTRNYYTVMRWPGSRTMAIQEAQKENRNIIFSLDEALAMQDPTNQFLVQGLFDGFIVPMDFIFTASNEKTPFGKFQKPFGPCLIIQDTDHTKRLQLMPLDAASSEMFKKALLADLTSSQKVERSVRICLCYPEIDFYQQGQDPINLKEMQAEPSFPLLMAKFKFISGKTSGYTKGELELLQAWFNRHLASQDPVEFRQFFLRVLARKASIRKGFPTSQLASIFYRAEEEFKKMPSDTINKIRTAKLQRENVARIPSLKEKDAEFESCQKEYIQWMSRHVALECISKKYLFTDKLSLDQMVSIHLRLEASLKIITLTFKRLIEERLKETKDSSENEVLQKLNSRISEEKKLTDKFSDDQQGDLEKLLKIYPLPDTSDDWYKKAIQSINDRRFSSNLTEYLIFRSKEDENSKNSKEWLSKCIAGIQAYRTQLEYALKKATLEDLNFLIPEIRGFEAVAKHLSEEPISAEGLKILQQYSKKHKDLLAISKAAPAYTKFLLGDL